MAHELTHASFFSGVGGLDLGLERAGWRTVSFSEIDPYASAVLAERWPDVPNLGDITGLAAGTVPQRAVGSGLSGGRDIDGNGRDAWPPWVRASLWSGGFPCQDLSVAGKRAGFAGERSSLAFAFLDLVERHRPPAILLENVPGLLSSNGGRDLGALFRAMGELGYGWAYRILDARHFGVPQRRRRVFIVGLHAGTGLGADSAAEVLSVGTRCGRHPATGHATGEAVAGSVAHSVTASSGHHGHSSPRGDGSDNLVGTISTDLGHHGGAWGSQAVASGHVIADGQHGSSPDPGGVRAADGLARRLDDSRPVAYVKRARVSGPDTPESWEEGGVMNTLNSFDVGDIRTTAAILSPTLRVGPQRPQDGGPGDTVPIVQSLPTQRIGTDDNDAQAGFIIEASGVMDDPLLPLGLDSHRYRCCGNGVVSSVAEWIGLRLAEVLA